MNRADFISQFFALGYAVTEVTVDNTRKFIEFPFKIPVGKFSGKEIKLSFEIAGDAPITVSVRPEIVSRHSEGTFSYTKFRFSKSKVAGDASEIVLLLLLKFGQARSGNGFQIDPQHTKLVDCFARNVIVGLALPRVRERQLSAALHQVVSLWPAIRPIDDPLNGLQFAG